MIHTHPRRLKVTYSAFNENPQSQCTTLNCQPHGLNLPGLVFFGAYSWSPRQLHSALKT